MDKRKPKDKFAQRKRDGAWALCKIVRTRHGAPRGPLHVVQFVDGYRRLVWDDEVRGSLPPAG